MSNKAFFVGDHVALDFLNTIAAPRGETIESIPNGEGYLAWLADAALVDQKETSELLKKFGKEAVDRVATEARELREWFRRELVHAAKVQKDWRTPEVIAKLNTLLASDSAYWQLKEVEGQKILREERRLTKAQQLLIPVVQKIAELLTHPDQILIKLCANPNCTLWFFDRTKSHRRLFCSTAVCGNRAKVAAYRERQRERNN